MSGRNPSRALTTLAATLVGLFVAACKPGAIPNLPHPVPAPPPDYSLVAQERGYYRFELPFDKSDRIGALERLLDFYGKEMPDFGWRIVEVSPPNQLELKNGYAHVGSSVWSRDEDNQRISVFLYFEDPGSRALELTLRFCPPEQAIWCDPARIRAGVAEFEREVEKAAEEIREQLEEPG